MSSYWQEPAYTHGTAPRTGVLLVNLGTPTAPTAAALRPYLKEFLSDPRVVEIPRPIWWLILNGIILNTRPAKSAKKAAAFLAKGCAACIAKFCAPKAHKIHVCRRNVFFPRAGAPEKNKFTLFCACGRKLYEVLSAVQRDGAMLRPAAVYFYRYKSIEKMERTAHV